MDDFTLYDLWTAVKHRKWTVLVTLALIMLAAGGYIAVTPRVYEAEATLIFPKQPDSGLSPQFAQLAAIQLQGQLANYASKDIYMAVLKSRSMAAAVAERLALKTYGIRSEDLQDNLALAMTKEGGLSVSCEVPTTWLKGRVGDSMLPSKTAELSAEITNAYIHELRDYEHRNSLSMSKKNRLFVEEQLVRTKQELSDAERKLAEFQARHPSVVPPEKSSIYAEQLVDLAAKNAESQIELRAAEQRAESVRSVWSAGAPSGVPQEALVNSPTIEALRGQLAKLEVKRATLLEDLNEEHPEVIAARQEIDKTRKRIATEVQQIVNGKAASVDPAHQEMLKQLVLADIDRDSLSARRAAFSDTILRLEKRASGLPPVEMKFMRLQRDLKANEIIYNTLLAEHAKALVAEDKQADNFIVLDYAAVPTDPAQPRAKLVLLSALLAGLMLGIFLASNQITHAPEMKAHLSTEAKRELIENSSDILSVEAEHSSVSGGNGNGGESN